MNKDDAVSRDFQIGDEVRIIGSDPIYDDCDVGWVIRNASERVKTMYVMRNDGSADEEAKAEWYKTGRHNAMLAEVIKALPSVTQNPIDCDDAISRDALITKLEELIKTSRSTIEIKAKLIPMIQDMPPVTQKPETVTEFADRCRECGAKYGKYRKEAKRWKNKWLKSQKGDVKNV